MDAFNFFEVEGKDVTSEAGKRGQISIFESDAVHVRSILLYLVC
jgi:hypothetical protein